VISGEKKKSVRGIVPARHTGRRCRDLNRAQGSDASLGLSIGHKRSMFFTRISDGALEEVAPAAAAEGGSADHDSDARMRLILSLLGCLVTHLDILLDLSRRSRLSLATAARDEPLVLLGPIGERPFRSAQHS